MGRDPSTAVDRGIGSPRYPAYLNELAFGFVGCGKDILQAKSGPVVVQFELHRVRNPVGLWETVGMARPNKEQKAKRRATKNARKTKKKQRKETRDAFDGMKQLEDSLRQRSKG